jgi:hypothetical protein
MVHYQFDFNPPPELFATKLLESHALQVAQKATMQNKANLRKEKWM